MLLARGNRDRLAGPLRGQQTLDVALVGLECLGELLHRWRASERSGQVAVAASKLAGSPLQFARDPQRRAAIAQMATYFSLDRRRRERPERHAATRIEPVGRLDQADCADLDEVVERLRGPGVPTGRCANERKMRLNQPLPRDIGGMR